MTPRSPHSPFILSPSAMESAHQRFFGEMGRVSEALGPDHVKAVDADSVLVAVSAAVESIVGEPVKHDQPLMEAGIDSLGATELQQQLADTFSVELPSTLVFDYPTVDAMAEFLFEKLAGDAKNLQASANFSLSSLETSESVSVVASSGQTEILQNWKLGDASTRVPLERWDVNSNLLVDADGSMPAQFGVFMKNVEYFDSELFGIMKSEALAMDPQQRLLLQQSYDALSGIGGVATVFGRQVGAFVGIAATDYESLSHRNGLPINAFSFTSASPSVASGRLAYIFAARGPAVSIDTACSASLVAAHMACSAFKESHMESAIAGGVLLCLVPESTLMLSRAQMISPEGRSKTLDASADGYARGEACRTLVLMPTGKGGYDPCALIVGSSVNTNGRASSLTAPNGPSQQQLLREAWYSASARPGDIRGIQLHSNGTSLGDPIEIGAISALVFVSSLRCCFSVELCILTRHLCLQSERRPHSFLLATVKGYTGHQESAAGAVGLVEAVQVATRQSMAPALHVRHLNPHATAAIRENKVSIARSGPMSVPQDARDMLIGVSSFGAQGTNAHALIQGCVHTRVLEAQTAERLPWKLERMWVTPKIGSMLDMAWTRRRTRNHTGSVTFETRINLAKNANFVSNQIYGQPHLLATSLAATLISSVEMLMTDSQSKLSPGILGSTFPAPVILSRPGKRLKVSEILISTLIKPSTGLSEITYQHQKVMAGKLSFVEQNMDMRPVEREQKFSIFRQYDYHSTSSCVGSIEASIDTLTGASSLEAIVTLAGDQLGPLQSPPTWVRTLEALSFRSFNLLSMSKHVTVKSVEEDGWAIGCGSLGSGEVQLTNLIIGEHDLPPTSPGPLSAQTPKAELLGELEEEDSNALPADHPLLLMTEEERLMHLQTQVCIFLHPVNAK